MAFATTDELGIFVQRTLAGAELAAATLLLDLATSAIQTYVGQTVEHVDDDVVILTGTWRRTLVLPQYPVESIAAVRVANFDLDVTSDFTWQRNGILSRFPQLRQSLPPWSLYAGDWGGPDVDITVTYTHGVTTIPNDCKQACLEHASWRLHNPSGELTRFQQGDLVEQYALGAERGLTAKSWKDHVRGRRLAARARLHGVQQ